MCVQGHLCMVYVCVRVRVRVRVFVRSDDIFYLLPISVYLF